MFVDVLASKIKSSESFKEVKLTSITFQHAATSNDAIPYVEDEELTLFYGDSKTYHERIADCVFEVSNSSFLQINIA